MARTCPGNLRLHGCAAHEHATGVRAACEAHPSQRARRLAPRRPGRQAPRRGGARPTTVRAPQ
eukprot:2182293-Prymnesium_polylepis.2